MTGRESHPRWCAQGDDCHEPKRASDGTVEWDHTRRTVVPHLDGAAEVCTVRMDAVTVDGRHDVTKAIVISADGTFSGEQAVQLALAILQAAEQLQAGLDGTPGTGRRTQ